MLDRAGKPRSLVMMGAVVAATACGPRPPPQTSERASSEALPDVRTADGRPPVVLIVRDGDPAAAIAVAITTAGIGWQDGPGDDPEVATALAGLVQSRLRARNVDAVVTPSWSGVRASTLARTENDGIMLTSALHEALTLPAAEGDLPFARRKLDALARRPLRDRALARWARCVGEPLALPERAGRDYSDVGAAQLERWRAAALGLGRVAFSVTAPRAIAEAVASSVLRGPEWKVGAPIARDAYETTPTIEVIETAPDTSGAPRLHMTLDVGTSSAAVTTAEALGDPRGPLASRLEELDLPFRLKEVTGAAHARGGCVGVVLDAAASSHGADATGGALAARVADAIALVNIEAAVFLSESGSGRDGRILSRRSGDARDAAERAAWWALVDQSALPSQPGGGSVVLDLPSRRGAKDASLEPSSETLADAVARARSAWGKPIVEARSRVESGQGEAWVLVGSPCGTDNETDADAGLTALFVAAAADAARTSEDVRVEPWVAVDGAGLVVHGPALAGEAPAAHARRLADIGARSFAAEPLTGVALGRARADLLRHDAQSDGAVLSLLASVVAPQHPSWILPWGVSEPLARSSDGSVRLRAQSLRAGPVRVAVLANTDASQADAAVRAADRWVARHSNGERACRPPSTAAPLRPGTYAAASHPGSIPEAYLAYPFQAGDEAARGAAMLVVSALSDGEGALLDSALGGTTPLAREHSARVIGWPRAPALVVRIVAAESSLDAAVMQARALMHRVQEGGLATRDFERALRMRERSELATALDPRTRLVATWRGEPLGTTAPRLTQEDVRAFAQKHLGEDSMVVVAARPPRPATAP